MPQRNRGAVARLLTYDEYTRSWQLKAPYQRALWMGAGVLAIAWVLVLW